MREFFYISTDISEVNGVPASAVKVKEAIICVAEVSPVTIDTGDFPPSYTPSPPLRVCCDHHPIDLC